MATTNLGLPIISGNMTADVVRDMNALAEAVDGKVGVTGGLAKQDDLATVSNALTSHQSNLASQTAGKGASLIGVEDAGARFTGTNIEAVLSELFTFANDGKTNIASVIGSPAVSGDTFTQLKTHIQNNKNVLATNLTNKGQTSVSTEPLANLVAKVANVNTGKKWASGTFLTDSLNGKLQATGLDFTAGVIVWSSSVHIGVYVNDAYEGYIGKAARSSSNSSTYNPKSSAIITSTSFDIDTTILSTNLNWWAFEL